MQRELDDVDMEIQRIVGVLSLTPDDYREIPGVLFGLAQAHDKRFNLRNEPEDIEKVIEYLSILSTLIPDSLQSPALPSLLGISHGKRFRCIGNLNDLEMEIEYTGLALAMMPDGHPDLPRRFYILAGSHEHRFERLGELSDIEKAIEHNSQAVLLTPENDPDLPVRLNQLGVSHKLRFGRLGELNDMEKAIEHQSRSVALTPDGHPGLPRYLADLAVSHKNRFRRLGDLGDLEKAIEYHSRALALTSDDHPDLLSRLGNLATSLAHRYERLSEISDVDRAIEYESRALDLAPNHPDVVIRLSNLAVFHKYRYQHLGGLGELEKAIEYGLRALALTPDDHPDMLGRLGNQAVYHQTRFRRLGELGDLEQAIEYHSLALELTPDDHPYLSDCLANLSASQQSRFERLGELGDLEQAINYSSRALALTPDDHPHLPERISNLSLHHLSRFKRLGELSDLEHAIVYGSRTLALTAEEDPDLSRCLANTAVAHKFRFRRLSQLKDLELAIQYESRALAAITQDHQNSCLWHFNHATSYLQYYAYSFNPTHLQKSLSCFRVACALSTGGVPRERFSCAHRWADIASKSIFLDPIEAYQATINLLPQFIWLGATNIQRYEDLKTVQTLAVDAACAAILSSNHSLALEWLEHARCIVWNQNLMLRSPLDKLKATHPSLAADLQTIADHLCNTSSDSRVSQALLRSMTPEQVAQEHRRLAINYDRLLGQVRVLPGFEDFLRPMKVDELLRAARNGPIIVINCHNNRCDALLVLPNQTTVGHLPLPAFDGKKARSVRSQIESSLARQGIRERGVHILRQPGAENEFASALKTLWTDVVKPILDFMGYTAQAPTDSRPHITWCPTGVASFLPFHAAGDYDQPCSRVFDYVVSSYTPTLAALLDSSPSTLGHDSRVLAIGQAATPGQSRLPGTTAELRHVKSHVETRAGYLELIDTQATPLAVLDEMEKHNWVHLACHAHQNAYDSTKSGFFLHKGTLDLAAISRRSFKRKGLAFLSACQTAMGDETLPEEAVHLASGMLMAGYSSVIATMWSIGDAEAPFVADKVYSQLMKERTLGNGEAGRALHHAVSGLRESVGEREFGRWVPFIHIGS